MGLLRRIFPRGRGFTDFRRLLRDQRGGPAMEFALIAPILSACLVATFDIGNALQQYIRLGEAVRAGGMYAYSYPVDYSNNVNATAIAAAVNNAVPDWTDLPAPTVTMACYCWDRSANDTTFASSPDCATATSSTCGSTAELRRYITIAASKPFSPILISTLGPIGYTHVVRFQ